MGNNIDGISGNFTDPGGNNLNGITSGALFTDNGIAGSRGTSAVTVTVTSSDAWNTDSNNGTPNGKLMDGIIKAGNAQGAVPGGQNVANTFSVNNLNPAFHYKLIAYGSVNNGGNGDPNNGGSVKANFGLSGLSTYDTYYFLQQNDWGGSNFIQGTNTTNVLGNRAIANYVQWSDVVPDAMGKLNFSYIWAGGGDGVGVNGFQLIQLALPTGVDRFWNAGAGSGTWDTSTTIWRSTNTDGASDATFAATDKANFGNLGSAGGRTVDVTAGGVQPGEFNVNNALGNPYTIQGGVIGGLGAPLVKDGAGALTLTAANTFDGAVTIKHGTVNVTTIGDAATAGNLGKGGALTIGDTAGANDAKLSYGGSTATAGRSLTIGSNGGEVAVTTVGQTLTLSGTFGGSGPITKSGPGNLTLPGSGSFTGGITVSGGTLTAAGLASSGAAINVSGGGGFTYSGASLNDSRSLTIGAGGGTIGVSNANTRYRIGATTATAGALTVGGSGRLVVSGVANLSATPTIGSSATLALTNEAGTNTLPAALTVSQGTLELAPGSFTAATPITLSGGTLRLGHEGAQGKYYSGAVNNPNDLPNYAGTAQDIGSYFAGINAIGNAVGNPDISARTTTGGQTNLDFNNGNGGGGDSFASQGFTTAGADNVRSLFIGKILITNPGDTTFFTSSDDGSGIFIDGQRVVNNNFFQGMTERSGTVNLTAGLHDFAMYFYEGQGGAGVIGSYTPAGGAKQVISNSVLYAGDTFNSTATNISVTDNSTLQNGGLSLLGQLTVTGGKTLSVQGSANFASTQLDAGGATHTINTSTASTVVNLGPITAINAGTLTIDKNGAGALLFNGSASAGLTLNNNAGLVVIQALNDGINPQNDPLAGSTVVFNGGGLGFSAASGTTAPVNYTNNLVSAESYRVEAGRYGSSVLSATVNWNPANNNVAIASGKTATFNSTDTVTALATGYTLNVGSPVSGAGSVVVEQGTINFTAGGGVNNAGGLTNHGANVTISGPVNTGPISLTGSFGGVTTLSPTLTVNNSLVSTGAYSQAAGTSNLNATTDVVSLSISGGTFNANDNLTATGAVLVSGGTAKTNGLLTAASVLVNGSGALNVKNSAIVAGATTVDAGRTLNLDMGSGNTRTYAGAATVQNQGTLRAASGTTDFGSNAITVQSRTFASGLIESMNDNANSADNGFVLGQGRAGQPGTGGIKNGFRLGNDGTVNSTTAWGDNDLWVYTGQFYDADGQFSFAENVDDQVRVRIDGTLVLSSDQWDFASNTNAALNNNGPGGPVPNVGNNYGMGPDGNGWHNIEVRMYNGGGGAGPSGGATQGGGSGWTGSKGFVFSSTGDSSINVGAFTILTDPGNSSVLRAVSGGGYITVEAGAKIAAGSTIGAQTLQLNGDGSPAVFQLNNNGAATASSADTLKLNGGAPSGSVLLGDNNTFSIGKIIVPDGGTLTIDKAALATTGGVLKITGSVPGTPGTAVSTIATGSISVQGGTVLVNAPITGTGTVSASMSGTIGGSSTIAGPVTGNSGGTIAPGDLAGTGFELATFGTGNLTLNAGSTLKLDISDSLGFDSVSVTGSISLNNANLQVSLLNFMGVVGDIYYIVDNNDADAVTGTFLGLNDGDTYTGPGGSQFLISYDAITGGAFATGGNDIALQLTVVPEPGTFSALLGGFGMLMGMQRFRRRKA